jgi:serine/threonine-protein kinase
VLRSRIAELEADVSHGGESARGPGEYALGRGALALGDLQRTLKHLQAAWAAGFREPRVAYALALVNGQLYREGLDAAERAGGKDVRETARRELEKRYRDPALELLRQSQGAEVPSTGYVSALVAFYEGKLDEALAHAEAIGDSLPWFFEGPMLKAQILTARATRLADSGDSKRAAEDFDQGRGAAKVAAAIGESEPAAHLALAKLEYSAMRTATYGKGDVQAPFERGQAAVALALRAAPASAEALILEASFFRRLGEHRLDHGADAEESFQRAEQAALAARAASPGSDEARVELAGLMAQWSLLRFQQGRDPREMLDRGLRLIQETSGHGHDYDQSMLLGSLHHTRAQYEVQAGADPGPSRDQAIAAYQEAAALDGQSAAAWSMLGGQYKLRASRPGDADPESDLRRAAEALDRARALNPENWTIYFHSARLREAQAARARARGDDPRALYAEAIELLRAGSTVKPDVPNLHNEIGSVLEAKAREEWDHGGDPMPLLDQALGAFERAVALAPGQGFGQNNTGDALIERARYESALGRDPSKSLLRAEQALREAIQKLPQQAMPQVNLAAVQLLRARQELRSGRDPEAALATAEGSLAAAVKLNPKLARAFQVTGEAHAVRAEWGAARGRPFDAGFEKAMHALARASELDPGDPGPQLAMARTLWSWGTWLGRAGRNTAAHHERTRAAADAALAARPGWPEAAAIRAAALASLAPFAPPEEGPRLLAEARRQLDAALRQNPHLVEEWRPVTGTLGR